MIATDAKLVRILEKLEDRPVMDVARYHRDCKTLLGDIPTLRLDLRAEQNRLKLSANRTRLVSIKMELTKEYGYLAGVKKGLEDHLYGTYYNFLRGINNERSRNAIVARALAPLEARMRPLRVAMEVVDQVLSDYDSRGFAFRDLTAALRIGEREA